MATRRPVEEIIAESKQSVAKLDALLEELGATIDHLIAETEAEKKRSSKRRLW